MNNVVHQLLPGETMAQYRRRKLFETQCAAVASVIRQQPGIGSKDDIANATGFDTGLVAKCLRAIQRNETPFNRIDYGEARAKSGPWAGQKVVGWFPQDVAAYQHIMDSADKHSAQVEIGVRDSRVYRHLYAKGCTTQQAHMVVANIEDRMKVPVDKLTPAQTKTFIHLAEKQAIEIINRNGMV